MKISIVSDEKGIQKITFEQDGSILDEHAMEGVLWMTTLKINERPFVKEGGGDGSGRMPATLAFIRQE